MSEININPINETDGIVSVDDLKEDSLSKTNFSVETSKAVSNSKALQRKAKAEAQRQDLLWIEPKPDTSFLLPENFKVYTNGSVVINHPCPGFMQKTLPTFNDYKGKDGGYVAIYSHKKEGSVYGVGGGIYVVGQVRVKGKYRGRIFVPEGYKLGDNITQDPKLLKICEKYLPQHKGQIWVGGDTGGWFGI